jgi:hypothetical protein
MTVAAEALFEISLRERPFSQAGAAGTHSKTLTRARS